MPDRASKLLAGLAVLFGVAAALAGLSVFVEAWQASRAWAGSDEARLAEPPTEAPLWLDLPAVQPPASGVAQQQTSSPSTPNAPTPAHDAGLARSPGSALTPQPPLPTVGEGEQATTFSPLPIDGAGEARDSFSPLPRTGRGAGGEGSLPQAPSIALASPSAVEIAEVDFRFLDPPEPGAHARIAVTLVNTATVPTAPVGLIIPTRWLQSFSVLGAVPAVLDDRAGPEDTRQFVFGGLAPGERQTVEVHLTATAEEIEAPEVRVLLGDDAEIGRARPRTVAPRPRPGPARAVTIPKLGVRATVVPVTWEPPPFVVGQLHGTAAVSEGNTVLIGHLAGPQGDVFARLDRLRPGDEVVAVSRGLEYRFTVSELAVRPYDDVLATQPTATPRLTLMTCTGQWSITRQDYSHRLWVIAEPPELAQQTIRANAERAAQAAREAEEAAAARASHEAETTDSSAAAPPPANQASDTAAADRDQAPETAATSSAAGASTPSAPGTATPSAPDAATAPPRAGSSDLAPPSDPATIPAVQEHEIGVARSAAVDTTSIETEMLAPGIVVASPAEGARVSRRLIVHGDRTADADPQAPLWLLVRADVEGSRWYALDRPIVPAPDGRWQADVELGGPGGVRHEIRVGTVDAEADAALRRHAADRPGQPLDDLPATFRTGARLLVERQ